LIERQLLRSFLQRSISFNDKESLNTTAQAKALLLFNDTSTDIKRRSIWTLSRCIYIVSGAVAALGIGELGGCLERHFARGGNFKQNKK